MMAKLRERYETFGLSYAKLVDGYLAQEKSCTNFGSFVKMAKKQTLASSLAVVQQRGWLTRTCNNSITVCDCTENTSFFQASAPVTTHSDPPQFRTTIK